MLVGWPSSGGGMWFQSLSSARVPRGVWRLISSDIRHLACRQQQGGQQGGGGSQP